MPKKHIRESVRHLVPSKDGGKFAAEWFEKTEEAKKKYARKEPMPQKSA